MNKKELRKEYINIRKNICNKNEKSKIIIEKICDLDIYKNAKVIAVYNSLDSEVNTKMLIQKSLQEGKKVYIPKVINSYKMEFYKISNLDDDFIEGSFGIKEPKPIKENTIDKEKIDLMIIPGVCFDKNKNRIGFGKGYYDKYLSSIKKQVYKIAICYDEQILLNNYIEKGRNDIMMDLIISDKNIIK